MGATTAIRPDGTVATRDRMSSPTDDGRAGRVVTEGRYGPFVRDYDRSYTRGDGATRSSTTTGPNGRAITTEGGLRCSGSVCTRDVIQTGPQGRVRGVQGESQRLAPRERAGSRTVTRPAGQSRSRDRRWKRVRR